MSWLRTDDSFDTHPKILGLGTDGRRWTWQRILIYTSRYNGAVIPSHIAETIPKATRAFLKDCVSLGLIDLDNDGTMRVHDWDEYNGASIERREAWREKKEKQRGQSGDIRVDERGPSRAAAAAPVPSPSHSSKTLSALHPAAPGDSLNGSSERDELTELMNQLAANDDDRAAAQSDSARSIATARFSLAQPHVDHPLAYYRAIWRTGQYPEQAGHVGSGVPLPLFDELASWIRGAGYLDTESGVQGEIADRERRRREQLTAEQHDTLVELWRHTVAAAQEPAPLVTSDTGQADAARGLLSALGGSVAA